MKKLILLAVVLFGANIAVLSAQENALPRDLLIDESVAVVDEDAAADAKASARRLLQQQPRVLRKQSFPELRQKRYMPATQAVSRTQAAPFGLIWGASIADTKNQGVKLMPIEQKDYVNSFAARDLPKAVEDFERVDITFGQEDELWRIIAYGRLLDDDASASKVLRLYKIYAGLLTRKYGHAEEFFTPARIEETVKDERGRDAVIKKEAPLGNPDFLAQLQSGAAELYSTYYNEEVGAALSVNVDGDGKSYIVIDYKNLKILQSRENETLDAL